MEDVFSSPFPVAHWALILNIIFQSYFFFLQLNMAKKKEAFLQEFIEGPLHFKPTYKFDLYSDVYDTR